MISTHTAKAHVFSILSKLGVTKRINMAIIAIQKGWVEVISNNICQNSKKDGLMLKFSPSFWDANF